MKIKTIIIVFVILLLTFFTKAQQVPFYNQHIINPVVYNPAYAGFSDQFNAFVTRGQRNRWFNSGAITNTFSVDGPFFIPNSGFGLYIGQQSIGLINQLTAKLSYSYAIKFNKEGNHRLAFGVSGGYLDNRLRTNAINVLHQEDPFLVGMQQHRPSYNFNFGMAYQWKGLNIGLSVPQLIGNKIKYSGENSRGYYMLSRHFMGTVGYDFTFKSAPKVTLTPHALVRYIPGAPIQYDATLQVDYQPVGWLSVTYKADYAMQFNIGFHLFDHLYLGYSYEYLIGSMKRYVSGVNQEFLLGYTFSTKKKVKIKSIEKPNTSLINENKRLKQVVKKKEEKIEDLKDQLAKRLDNLQDSINALKDKNAKIRKAASKYYHFVETGGANSPAGYYVVIGVYAKDKNVQKNLAKGKQLFPHSYVVINQKNTYTYIVIHYSKDRESALKAYDKYQQETEKDVWILSYKVE